MGLDPPPAPTSCKEALCDWVCNHEIQSPQHLKTSIGSSIAVKESVKRKQRKQRKQRNVIGHMLITTFEARRVIKPQSGLASRIKMVLSLSE